MKISSKVLAPLIGVVALALLFTVLKVMKVIREAPDDRHAEHAFRLRSAGNSGAGIGSAARSGAGTSVYEEQTDMVGMLDKGDINSAVSFAQSIQNENARVKMIGIIASHWAKVDSGACYSWADALKDPLEKSSALTGLVLSLVEDGDLESAKLYIERTSHVEFKDDMIVYGLRGIAEKDLQLAIEMSGALSGDGALMAASKVIAEQILKDVDISDIAHLIDEIPYGTARNMMELEMARRISENDPQLGFDWAIRAGATAETQGRMLGIVSAAFGKSDPLGGLEVAKGIEDPRLKQQFLHGIGAAWGRGNPVASSSWVMDQIRSGGCGENKNMIYGAIEECIQWNQKSFFEDIISMENSVDRDRIMLVAAGSLSKFNPQHASEILVSMEDHFESKEAVSAVTKLSANWLQKDSLAASRWIQDLPAGPSKDSALSVLVVDVLVKDRDAIAARRWADGIQNKDQRMLAMARIAEMERGSN